MKKKIILTQIVETDMSNEDILNRFEITTNEILEDQKKYQTIDVKLLEMNINSIEDATES